MTSTAATRVFPVMIALIMGLSVSAQMDREERRAELDEKRQAYINEEADLSESEAKAFWALMDKMHEEKKALRDKGDRKSMREDSENLSEAEMEALLRQRQENKVAAEQIELDYLDDFIKILGAKKLNAVHQAERSFKKTMLKEMRGERRERGAPGERRGFREQ